MNQAQADAIFLVMSTVWRPLYRKTLGAFEVVTWSNGLKTMHEIGTVPPWVPAASAPSE